MNHSLPDLLQRIRLKTSRLMAEKQDLENQIAALKTEIDRLTADLVSEKNRTGQLAEQNKIVNIAVSLQNKNTDKEELKRLVNRYIREIDECIRLIGETH